VVLDCAGLSTDPLLFEVQGQDFLLRRSSSPRPLASSPLQPEQRGMELTCRHLLPDDSLGFEVDTTLSLPRPEDAANRHCATLIVLTALPAAPEVAASALRIRSRRSYSLIRQTFLDAVKLMRVEKQVADGVGLGFAQPQVLLENLAPLSVLFPGQYPEASSPSPLTPADR
jgi:hypothetical protein